MKLINIGFGNLVSAGRIISIVSPESAPIKRMVQDRAGKGTFDGRVLWQEHKIRYNHGQRQRGFVCAAG